jgi:YD repeat-containing protein
MLDQPDYSLPVSLTAPVGAMTVVQTVYRDVYGKPYRVEQGGDATVAKTFAYDAYYNLCRVTEPETGSTIIATDANGNVAWSANGLGYAASGDEHDCGTTTVTDSQKAVRSYGQVGELTGVAYGDGSPSASFIHTGTGLLAQAKVSGAQWDYGYNSLDKLTSETLTIDGHAWSFTYAYDGNGALLSTTYPDGNVISSQPDALGRPTGAGAFASGGQYLPSGGLAQFSFGSGAVYNATENTRGLPINLSYGTASAVAVAEDVGYDKRSDVTSVNDLVGSGSRSKTFGYDALRRLQSASSPMWGSDIYTYNALGDLTSITNGSSQTGFSYQNGQLVTVTKDGVATPYHYDNRGNVVQRGTQGFTYDLAERMSSAVGLESYQYDGNGNRVKSVSSSGGTTYTVYGQSGRLLMTFDGTTGKATDYIYLGGKLVATQSNLLAPSAAPVLSAPATGQVGTTFPVAWTAVTAATTYSLQESVSGSGYVTIYSGASLSQSLTKASAGSYAYRVQACNSVGCGPWSAIGTTTVAAPPAAPDAPAAIAAVLSGDLSIISVSWSASSGATSYVVQEKVGNGAWAAFYSGSGTSAAVSNPADGAYAFQVQACSANGCSAWTLSTATTVAHIPPTPGAISVPGTNAGSFTVSWSASAYATYYALDVSVNGQAFDAVGNVAATSYSTTVGASGTYAYRVRACNGNGCSGYTGVTTTSTLLKPTAAPGISNSGNNSTGSFSVAWSAVTDGATYTLQEQVNGGAFSVVQSSGSLSWSTGGRGSATYGYQVQACNTSGCGPWSGTSGLTVAIIPATPSYVTLTESGPTGKFRINASWSAVSAATSYQLEQTSPEEGTVIVQNSAATTYSVLLFENGTIRYRVKACNANGCSAFGPYSSTQILNGN